MNNNGNLWVPLLFFVGLLSIVISTVLFSPELGGTEVDRNNGHKRHEPYKEREEPIVGEQYINLIERLGVPTAVVVCSFWFILFLTKSNQRQQEQFLKKDEEYDARLMLIIENSSNALTGVKVALEKNTETMRELLSRKV